MSGQESVSEAPTQIAIAVVEREGEFLVRQRPPGAPLAGLWEFPGGKIKPGESPAAAAQRECLEETRRAVEIVGAYPLRTERYSHGTVALHFFAAQLAVTTLRPEPSWRWVPRTALAELKFPSGNRNLIELLLAEAPASDV